jgi:hypothetical protein
VDGFEFENGSGNWKPILDQTAVQRLRTLKKYSTVQLNIIGSNRYSATMSHSGVITQRNRVYGTCRRVRKNGAQQPMAPPVPRPVQWQAPQAAVTERWLRLAGACNTEAAVRQLFAQRCGHGQGLQIESATAVCQEASLKAFRAGGNLDVQVKPNFRSDALLFHGTRQESSAANMMAGGLKRHFANANAMLGPGIYGAEDPRKASQYARRHVWPVHVPLPLQS